MVEFLNRSIEDASNEKYIEVVRQLQKSKTLNNIDSIDDIKILADKNHPNENLDDNMLDFLKRTFNKIEEGWTFSVKTTYKFG